ncbi:MAG: hypothetical protein RLP14_03015 [Owenweeksia sp.]
MKKLILAALFTIAVAAPAAFAQNISQNAIGVRLEGDDGIGPEISYQRALGDNNRLELDLGFRDSRYIDAFKFTGLYHWVFNIEGGFNWFVGLGAGVGFVDYDDDWPRRNDPFYDDDDYETVFLTLDGDIGIEYSFRELGVPIQLALDLNPEIELINEYYGDDFDLDLGFSIRYQF